MLTALLAPKGTRRVPPLPEEIGDVEEGAESEDDFDWQWKQELYNEDEKDELCLPGCCYGFGNLRSGVFIRLQDELSEVADVKDPDQTSILERRNMRLQAEDAKFDSDHYLADLFECSSFPDLMLYEPWWKLCRKSQLLGLEEDEKLIPLGEDEKEAMLKLPRRKPCLLGRARHEALLGMVDILLAYAYDVRTTEGDPTVESPWTIRKLSGTLCWFETFQSLHEVLVCFARRVVCYPLFRRFDLALQAVADAADILKLGRRASLKALLAVHRLFQKNDPAYILNDLYLTEYCVWTQHLSSKRLKSFGEAVSSEQLCKEELGFDLEVLEAAGLATLHEQVSPVTFVPCTSICKLLHLGTGTFGEFEILFHSYTVRYFVTNSFLSPFQGILLDVQRFSLQERGLSNEASCLQKSQSGTSQSDCDESDADESTSTFESSSDSESSSDGNGNPEFTTKVSSNNDCDDVTAILTQLQLDHPGPGCEASDEVTARKPLIEELD
uniref:Protein SHQ1 homolog n=1 Tax=Eptatretus burgeri TaxID=7764 RepID=A0A8C4Q136_EPTBU